MHITESLIVKRDHPRLCGKDGEIVFEEAKKPGSPPLMREGQKQKSGLYQAGGITPAYAGRTMRPLHRLCLSQDHPRLCGKDQFLCHKKMHNLGSPPLMREGHTNKLMVVGNTGITPAYAGRTGKLFLQCLKVRDHPRLCGKDLEQGL